MGLSFAALKLEAEKNRAEFESAMRLMKSRENRALKIGAAFGGLVVALVAVVVSLVVRAV